jgi:hypothetical protein
VLRGEDPCSSRPLSCTECGSFRSLSLTLSGHGINAAYATPDGILITILLIGDGVADCALVAGKAR